jgi:hypothetical protein
MKRVLKAIHQGKQTFSDAPLFAFLRDESIPPLERLAFYPIEAQFIMSLGDLDRRFFREAPPASPSRHTPSAPLAGEDQKELSPALRDELVDAASRPFSTDRLRLLFSHKPLYHRRLSYRLADLLRPTSGWLRIAILRAIEEASNVFLSVTAAIAQRVEGTTGVKLHYLRRSRTELSWGEQLFQEQPIISRIELDQKAEAAALEAVEEVFSAFTEWTTAVLDFAHEEAMSAPIEKSGEWLILPRALAS